MSNFMLTKQHLLEVLIFCFNWKKSFEAHQMLFEVYGDIAPTDKSCRRWFQGWRFQRWRQASLWIAKKIRRQKIRDITRRRSESNARRACRIIGGNSTSRFCTTESHGNDLKTRKLGALWTETERHWKAIFHLWTIDSKTTEKRFFASNCNWRWEMNILRQPQEEKILR